MTNVRQELVPSNNIKAEIILKDGTFVTIEHLKIKHVMVCEDSNKMMHGLKLITCLAKFDNEVPTAERILNLDPFDYNYILYHIFK